MEKALAYQKVGKIIRIHGLKGQVIFNHSFPSNDPFIKLDHLFIELHPGSYIPFFPEVSPIMVNQQTISWQLEDINSPQQAQKLLGKEVYIEKELFSQLFPESNQFEAKLDGFQLKDNNSGYSAIIKSTQILSGQLMATVSFQEKSLYIPLNEDFIQVIDTKKRIIIATLPEGIWEL